MDRLTNRQRAVALLVMQGLANKEIAHRLGITLGTVKVHLNVMFRVLEVISRYQLTVKLMGEQREDGYIPTIRS